MGRNKGYQENDTCTKWECQQEDRNSFKKASINSGAEKYSGWNGKFTKGAQ